jgi:hypothetical protein
MEDKCCKNCRFLERDDERRGGECRRYAPRPIVSEPGHGDALWPLVDAREWCGEFEESGD